MVHKRNKKTVAASIMSPLLPVLAIVDFAYCFCPGQRAQAKATLDPQGNREPNLRSSFASCSPGFSEISTATMEYSYRAEGTSNDELIDRLKEYGIVQPEVVERVMRAVDRGNFAASPEEAYLDRPHSIGSGQTISAPHMHSMCLELLKEHAVPGAKVLDVGSGSGYLCACLGHMVGETGKVIGIDRLSHLVRWSTKNLKKDCPQFLESGRVVLKEGDGWKGEPAEAPFDCIHVGAAAATLPEALVQQLKQGGRLVIPVGESEQALLQVDKDKNGRVTTKKIMGVRYVPLVKGSNLE